MSNIKQLFRGISALDVRGKDNDPRGKYDRYLARLRSPMSIAEAVATVRKLITWINQYQLGNPSEPWLAGRKLANARVPGDARLAASDLLKACLESQQQLPIVVRLMFFHDIRQLFVEPEDLDLKLIALRVLTKQGRDISGIEDVVCSLCVGWIDGYLEQLNSRRPISRRGRPLDSLQRHIELRDLLGFITDLAKFHFIVLDENDVRLLVDQVIAVCKRTSVLEDIEAALGFFDATIRYGYIPLDGLPEVVNVLCSVCKSLDALESPALGIVQKLLQSHMAQAGLHALKDILSGKRDVHEDVVSGALLILVRLRSQELRPEAESRFGLSTYTVFAALLAGITTETRGANRDKAALDTVYVRATFDIVKVECAQAPLSFDDWQPPLQIFTTGVRSLADADHGEELTAIYRELLTFMDSLLRTEKFFGSMDTLAELWSSLGRLLDESTIHLVLDHTSQELHCYPSNEDWLGNIRKLGASFITPVSTPEAVRVRALRHLRDVLTIAPGLSDDVDPLRSILLDLTEHIAEEEDSGVTTEAESIVTQIALHSTGDTFRRAIATMQAFCMLPKQSRDAMSSPPISMTAMLASRRASVDSVTSFSSVFTKASRAKGPHQQPLYPAHLKSLKVPPTLSQPVSRNPSAAHANAEAVLDRQLALSAGRGLIKIFLEGFSKTPSAETQSVYDCLITIAGSEDFYQGPRLAIIRFLGRLRADSAHRLYLDRGADEELAGAGRKAEGAEYDGVYSAFTCVPNDVTVGEDNLSSLAIDHWLECLVEMIHVERHWPVLSAVLEIMPDQMSNRHLLQNYPDALLELRTILCDQLSTQRMLSVQLPQDIKREDVIVRLTPILTTLVGYHHLFSKVQEDEIVAALQTTLMRYQKASTPCIHALFVCFHEIPMSTSKNLSTILLRLSQLITSTNASVHILELLTAIAKAPDQYVNFREEDYRRVFGIALQHIQHANAMSRDALATGAPDPLNTPMAAYVLSLAFDTVYAWFLAVKLQLRHKYLRWIVDGLLAAIPGEKTLDARGQVCYDFLVRFCYSNAEIRNAGTVFTQFEQEASTQKIWLYGNSIIALRTMHLSGLTEVNIRRPSGTVAFLCKPSSDLESLSVLSSADAKDLVTTQDLVGPFEMHLRNVVNGIDDTTYTPSHMLLQLNIAPDVQDNHKPVLLAEDDATRRALGTFDRIPVVDFHKIGVIFVGRGQTTQKEILSNQFGSPAFVEFLSGMGALIRLKDNKNFYTGGLDTSNDDDGEFAYAVKDKISQIIFHTTTLMPNHDHDADRNRKLAHIGNDYVTIVWNASNRPYDPDTIHTEFNFCSIVIAPDAYRTWHQVAGTDEDLVAAPSPAVGASTSTAATGHSHSAAAASEPFYKVKVLFRRGLQPLGPAQEWRLVSRRNLPSFVRTLAMSCNNWAQISSAGTYTSSWTQRLLQIRRIAERARPASTAAPAQGAGTTTGGAAASASSPPPQQHHTSNDKKEKDREEKEKAGHDDTANGYDFVSYN